MRATRRRYSKARRSLGKKSMKNRRRNTRGRRRRSRSRRSQRRHRGRGKMTASALERQAILGPFKKKTDRALKTFKLKLQESINKGQQQMDPAMAQEIRKTMALSKSLAKKIANPKKGLTNTKKGLINTKNKASSLINHNK